MLGPAHSGDRGRRPDCRCASRCSWPAGGGPDTRAPAPSRSRPLHLWPRPRGTCAAWCSSPLPRRAVRAGRSPAPSRPSRDARRTSTARPPATPPRSAVVRLSPQVARLKDSADRGDDGARTEQTRTAARSPGPLPFSAAPLMKVTAALRSSPPRHPHDDRGTRCVPCRVGAFLDTTLLLLRPGPVAPSESRARGTPREGGRERSPWGGTARALLADGPPRPQPDVRVRRSAERPALLRVPRARATVALPAETGPGVAGSVTS